MQNLKNLDCYFSFTSSICDKPSLDGSDDHLMIKKGPKFSIFWFFLNFSIFVLRTFNPAFPHLPMLSPYWIFSVGFSTVKFQSGAKIFQFGKNWNFSVQKIFENRNLSYLNWYFSVLDLIFSVFSKLKYFSPRLYIFWTENIQPTTVFFCVFPKKISNYYKIYSPGLKYWPFVTPKRWKG